MGDFFMSLASLSLKLVSAVYFSFMQSWKSPGPGNSRGSPDRTSVGTYRHPNPSIGESNLLSIEDRIEASRQQPIPPSIQTKLNPLQQHISPGDEDGADASITHGGSNLLHQSNSIGYASSARHRSLPQSYPGGQNFVLSSDDRSEPRTWQLRPPSIRRESHPLQQHVSSRVEGEASIIHGGSNLPRQSRLTGYTSSAHHRSQLQPYPAGQAFVQHSPQTFSSRFHPNNLSTESSPPGPNVGNIGEQSHTPLGSPQWSAAQSQYLGSPASQIGSSKVATQPWGFRFSPPQIPSSQAALPQLTSHPQIPRTLLPSIANLSVDTGTHNNTAEQPLSPNSTSASPPQQCILVPSDDSKPLPQNLRGDPFRSAKVKTELCRYYNTPKGCVFGADCNYAHGEEELKFNKLMDLDVAGMVDFEVFRCHVCLTWVATGACPFDKRCTRLHDPRVVGMQPSWLAHAEVLVNNTKKSKEREVDKLYHSQYSSIYTCSPVYDFAPKKRWKTDETSTNSSWKEFYSFCCNMDVEKPYSQVDRWRLSPQKSSSPGKDIVGVTEMHRLAIALMMRKSKKAQCYTYLPSHIFCGELCLLLQTRYFELKSSESLQLVQLSEEEAAVSSEAGNGDHIIVARQIAFGPVADASVRQVAIWFNIKEEDIVPCTRQQARKHRRSRHRIRAKRNYEIRPTEAKVAAFCTIPPFACHEPMDDAAFNLIAGIQTHRYRMLKYFSSDPDKHALPSLALEEEKLRKSFESQRRFWMTWAWPKKIGSSDIESEKVPGVDGTYNFVTYGDPGYGEDTFFFGSDPGQGRDADDNLEIVSKQAKLATGLVWKSFLMNLQLLSYGGSVYVPEEEDKMPTHDRVIPTIRRIPALRSLSLGYPPLPRSTRNIPTMNPPSCSTGPVVISLDAMMHEWKLLQRQHEETSSYPLKDAQQGNVRHPNPAKRSPLSYNFEEASRALSREIPSVRSAGTDKSYNQKPTFWQN